MSYRSNRPPSSTPHTTGLVAVLERNRAVAQRLSRVIRSASGFSDVVVQSDPATLRSLLTAEPVVLACDASDIDLALEWAEDRYPSMSIVAWTSGEMQPLLESALRSPKLAGLVGWPSFSSTPRPWEIAHAVRRLTDRDAMSPRLSEMFGWGSTSVKFRPRSSRERDLAVAEAASLAERAGAPSRVAARVGEVAHELLMNAMYDAPVDQYGTPKYAHDRKRELELDAGEVPTFRFASDGVHLALQTIDPFGGLTRDAVLQGILRGRSGASAEHVIDTSGGGAGLGLYRIYSQGTVMIVDVDPGHYTSVTVFFDLDINPREARSLPVSLHLYR